MERQLPRIVVHTDSEWALNVIRGKWRPKAHKKLVNYIRILYHTGPTKVMIQWAKAHVNIDSKAHADNLAEQGKGRADAAQSCPSNLSRPPCLA